MAKKTSNTAERIKKRQEKLLEHLSESGNVTYSCKRTGISRETYYCWREKDQKFLLKAETAIVDGKESVNDLAHTKLIRNLNDGYFPAVKFQLSNCHDDYHPKKTTSPYRIEEQTPVITIDSVPAIAKLKRYREYLEKGGSPNDWQE